MERRPPRPGRWLVATLAAVVALAQVPTAAAHGATATGWLTQELAAFLVLAGVAAVVTATGLKRLDRIPPTTALSGVFVGIVVAVLGAVLFEGLSPELTYTASSMPFPRSWYQPMALMAGLAITVGSFLVGWLRWPTRPRYTFFGILMGGWVLYPYLLPGTIPETHPLGYAIVLGTPVLLGYIVWKDAGSVLQRVLSDPVARWFGAGVALVVGLFFVTVTGYLSFFLEEGIPHETNAAVLPTVYQLVMWPTFELVMPHVPFFVAISPGQLIIVGTLSVLVGLNAAVIARQWRLEERAGVAEGTAGSAAIVGSCTCGCCGPLVAKVAVLAVGPSVAAPLYWVFVDAASPLSALFIVGSMALFAGSLVHSVESTRGPGQSTSLATAD